MPVSPDEKRKRTIAYAAFAAICLIWGTTFLGIRIAIETIPTLYITGLRFTSAGLILFAIARLRGETIPSSVALWRHEAATAVLMVAIANGMLVWAENFIPSGLTALLAATIPLWLAVIDAVFVRLEPLTLRRVAGLIIGFSGVALLVLPDLTSPNRRLFLLGLLGTQCSAIAWSTGTMRTKYRPSGVHGLTGPAMQMLLGGAMVLITAVITHAPRDVTFTMRSAAALAYLSIFGSVIGFTAYHVALKSIPPGRVSLYAYVNPAIAVIAGAVVLGEIVTLRMVVAMIVILGGVALAKSAARGAPAMTGVITTRDGVASVPSE